MQKLLKTTISSVLVFASITAMASADDFFWSAPDQDGVSWGYDDRITDDELASIFGNASAIAESAAVVGDGFFWSAPDENGVSYGYDDRVSEDELNLQ